MSTPDDKLQDRFENTNETNWGGFMAGATALVALDTIGIPIWAMHSVRETADLRDQDAMVHLVTSIFQR